MHKHPTMPSDASNEGRAADAVRDLLQLITTAERSGFPARRATVIRARADRLPSITPRRVRRLEVRTRAWLRRRGL